MFQMTRIWRYGTSAVISLWHLLLSSRLEWFSKCLHCRSLDDDIDQNVWIICSAFTRLDWQLTSFCFKLFDVCSFDFQHQNNSKLVVANIPPFSVSAWLEGRGRGGGEARPGASALVRRGDPGQADWPPASPAPCRQREGEEGAEASPGSDWGAWTEPGLSPGAGRGWGEGGEGTGLQGRPGRRCWAESNSVRRLLEEPRREPRDSPRLAVLHPPPPGGVC